MRKVNSQFELVEKRTSELEQGLINIMQAKEGKKTSEKYKIPIRTPKQN